MGLGKVTSRPTARSLILGHWYSETTKNSRFCLCLGFMEPDLPAMEPDLLATQTATIPPKRTGLGPHWSSRGAVGRGLSRLGRTDAENHLGTSCAESILQLRSKPKSKAMPRLFADN